jgi:uncharacterized protein YceK
MKCNLLFAATLCAALCGCGTMHNISGSLDSQRIYGGVRTDVKVAAQAPGDLVRAKDGPEFMNAAGAGALSVIDTPLSVVGDTVTLLVIAGRKLAEQVQTTR